jgi:Transglutaminase-like superfamily
VKLLRRRRPPELADARAAWWAWRALRAARARLRDGEMRDIALPAPPVLPGRASRAVGLVLFREHPSCLERALVLQSWLDAQGLPRDVVVGTEGSAGSGFAAHAWIEGEPQPTGRKYVEIARLAPRSVRGSIQDLSLDHTGPSRSSQ